MAGRASFLIHAINLRMAKRRSVEMSPQIVLWCLYSLVIAHLGAPKVGIIADIGLYIVLAALWSDSTTAPLA